MTTSSNIPDVLVETRGNAPAVTTPTRPMYWSIRRELWENRAVTMAPLIVAGVILLAVLLSTIGLPHRRRAALALDEARQRVAIQMPYDALAGMLAITAFFVAIFYCADALHGERRDRTILFWKSLPVSDRTTVLSKMSIPLVVLPLYTFVLILVAQLIVLAETTALLLMSNATPAMLRPQLKFTLHPFALAYGFLMMVLWLAPVYAWFVLVSGWAKRVALLWAVMPFFAAAIFERIAFGTTHIGRMIQVRLFGWFAQTFAHAKAADDPLALMTSGQIVAAIAVGLVFAAVFIALAIRLRRDREPI